MAIKVLGTTVIDDSRNILNTGTINASGNITAPRLIGSADTLTNARTVSLGGDLSGSATFDGSQNITITATVSNDSHTHDSRYYTETESDSRFVNATGDTMTGQLNIERINARGTELYIAAGEAMSEMTGGEESVYIGAEKGLVIRSSTDNLASGLNNSAFICDENGTSYFPGLTTTDGVFRARGDFPQIEIGQSSTSGALRFRRSSDGATAGKIGYITSSNSTVMEIFSQGGTAELHVGGQENVLFKTGASSDLAPERARIDANGRFGIGTSTPNSLMHLSSTGPVVLTLEADTDNIDESDTVSVLFSQDGGGITSIVGLTSDNDFEVIHQNASGNLIFGTDNTERARIDSNGRFGIGTTSPNAELDVSGSAIITDSLNVREPSDFWSSESFYSVGDFGNFTTQGSFAVDITSNGYRNGSGTWTSYGANASTGAAQISLLPTGIIYFRTETNKANGAPSSVDVRMTLDDTGLGIGTGSPNAELDVEGDIVFSSRAISNNSQTRDKFLVWSTPPYGIGMHDNFTFGGLNNYAMTFQMSDTSDRGFWWGHSNHANNQGAMALNTDGALTVADSIRVGFGESDTTDPGSVGPTIGVNGRIEAEFNGTTAIKLVRPNTTAYLGMTFADPTASRWLQYITNTADADLSFQARDSSGTIVGIPLKLYNNDLHVEIGEKLVSPGGQAFVGTVATGSTNGTIIQQGSNSNGEYVRFADGTQFCWTGFNSSSNNPSTWTFPAAFSGTPSVQGTATDNFPRLVVAHNASATSVDFYVYNTSGGSSTTTHTRMAIGRWN